MEQSPLTSNSPSPSTPSTTNPPSTTNSSTTKTPAKSANTRAQTMTKADLITFRAELATNQERLKGRIRKLKPEKGFGFISGDDGIDYFFHWTVVKKSSSREFRTFEPRDRVEFTPIQPPDQQWRAIEIEFIEE